MYKIAMVQFCPDLLDVDSNLARIEVLCRDLTVDLIVLPELATSGYVFQNREEVLSVSEPVPRGVSFIFFTNLARDLNSSVVFGFPELNGDNIYNSAALINPDGSYFIYRKTHLFFREKLFFAPGDSGFSVITSKQGVKIGIIICYDWQFPESARVLALQGAQIICHPANLVLPWAQQVMLVRALENRVFTITSNRTGIETNGDQSLTFTGQSQAVSPMGELLLRLGHDTEGVGIVEIDPHLADNKSVTDTNDAFSDRRPAFYLELVKPKSKRN